jgi:hypothetical protein
MRFINIVLAVWSIIVGGLIIFIDGIGGCVNCRGTLSVGAAVILVALAAISIVAGMGGRSAPSAGG